MPLRFRNYTVRGTPTPAFSSASLANKYSQDIPAISAFHTTVASCLHTNPSHQRAGDSQHIMPSPLGKQCTKFACQAREVHRRTCHGSAQSSLSIKVLPLIRMLFYWACHVHIKIKFSNLNNRKQRRF